MGMRLHDGVKYLYGNAWVGRYSFSPFVETVEQVMADIAAGFTYLAGEDMWTLKSANKELPDALQGTVLISTVEVEKQGAPVTESQLAEDWVTPGSEIFWDDVNIELHRDCPGSRIFEIRRVGDSTPLFHRHSRRNRRANVPCEESRGSGLMLRSRSAEFGRMVAMTLSSSE